MAECSGPAPGGDQADQHGRDSAAGQNGQGGMTRREKTDRAARDDRAAYRHADRGAGPAVCRGDGSGAPGLVTRHP